MLRPRKSERVSGSCWKLKKRLYGMRPLTRVWEEDYVEKLEMLGLRLWKAALTYFATTMSGDPGVDGRRMGTMQDEGMIRGGGESCPWAGGRRRQGYCRARLDGAMDPGRPSWRPTRGSSGNRLGSRLVQRCGLHGGPDGGRPVRGDEKLNRDESSKYRVVNARASYLGADGPGFQFAVKQACRGMAAPSKAVRKRVKRVARQVHAVVWL